MFKRLINVVLLIYCFIVLLAPFTMAATQVYFEEGMNIWLPVGELVTVHSPSFDLGVSNTFSYATSSGSDPCDLFFCYYVDKIEV